MLADESHVIHQLRVQGAGFDPLLTRLRADHLLNMVDFSPSRLSPSAVLCIRTLRDPLPGTLRLDDTQSFPNRAWQGAVRDELNVMVENAARPLFGSVPANAQSVLFANRAELLACLARDWQQGQIEQQWWWRGLLRGNPQSAAVDMWHRSPEYVPTALAHLGTSALMFVRALSLADVRRIFDAVLARYDLHGLRTALESSASFSAADLGSLSLSMTAPILKAPPWRAWIPESQSLQLAPIRELLLGVALTVMQQPTAPRTERFIKAVQVWLVDRALVAVKAGPARTPGSISTDQPAPVALETSASPFIDATPHEETPHAQSQPAPPEALGRVSQWRYEAAVEDDTPAQTPVQADEISDLSAPIQANRLPDAPLLDEALDSIRIISEFGGVFYLLNAAIALGLYGDFTMPHAPGLSLSPWDFLALMGTWFVGADFQADPIWPLLAGLSGRGAADPGHDFDVPETWRVLSEWLVPFEDSDRLVWARENGRLRVWDAAGFWVIDALTEDIPEGAVPGNVPIPQATSRLARWCEWLATYLRARLLVSFEMDDDTTLVPMLFAHTAHIAVTPARVEITLNLTTLPIVIRYAGLDRDPGWIPAAGRAVEFRFEV